MVAPAETATAAQGPDNAVKKTTHLPYRPLELKACGFPILLERTTHKRSPCPT